MIEITTALIKPDAMKNGHMIDILGMIEGHGFTVADMVKSTWTRGLVAQFYAEHRSRDFFQDLVHFMSSGPMIAMTLVREDAIAHWRFVMGATDPKKAAPGTIRNLWGSKTGPIMWNCVHGSDSDKRARDEMDMIRMAQRRQIGSTFPTMSLFGDEAVRLVQASWNVSPVSPVSPDSRCPLYECELLLGHEGPHRHKDLEADYPTHVTHCCPVHGCKYEYVGDPVTCPVVLGKIKREKNAGWCQEPNMVHDPEVCRLEGEGVPTADSDE